MSQEEYEGLLEIASEQVPFGIYAVEKQGYAELRNDKCKSITAQETDSTVQGARLQSLRE